MPDCPLVRLFQKGINADTDQADGDPNTGNDNVPRLRRCGHNGSLVEDRVIDGQNNLTQKTMQLAKTK